MNPIHIVIVEDDRNFAAIECDLVRKLIDKFPGSIVQVVTTMAAALALAAEVIPPDVMLLDLSLPPLTPPETLSHLDTLEDRLAVVIVTGHTEAEVRAIIGSKRDTPVVMKTPELLDNNGGILHRAIVAAVDGFLDRKYAKARARLDMLRRVQSVPAS
jgi:CheY-like chemotaxis protein